MKKKLLSKFRAEQHTVQQTTCQTENKIINELKKNLSVECEKVTQLNIEKKDLMTEMKVLKDDGEKQKEELMKNVKLARDELECSQEKFFAANSEVKILQKPFL